MKKNLGFVLVWTQTPVEEGTEDQPGGSKIRPYCRLFCCLQNVIVKSNIKAIVLDFQNYFYNSRRSVPEQRGGKMDENSTGSMPGDRLDSEEAMAPDIGTEKPENVLLTANGRKFLNQTRPWVRFLSIMVFIGAAFTLLGGFMVILVGLTGNFFGAGSGAFDQLPGGGFALGLIYMVMAVLYVPPGIFLSRYASAIKNLESTPTSQGFERALKYQKSFWRYIGIFTVIGLIVLAAALAFSLAVALFMVVNR